MEDDQARAQSVTVMKICSGCKESLPSDNFHKCSSRKDGLQNYCKRCNRAKLRDWARNNKESVRQYKKNRGAEVIRAYCKRWRDSNPDKVHAQNKRRYIKDKDKIIAKSLRWHKNNPDRVRELAFNRRQTQRYRDWVRRYYAENKSRIKDRAKLWRQKNPDAVIRYNTKRRVRIYSTEICDLTKDQWKLIKQTYDYRCVYCGTKPTQITQDHIVPLSRGGNHTASNIVPACRSCNSIKRDRDISVMYPLAVKLQDIF